MAGGIRIDMILMNDFEKGSWRIAIKKDFQRECKKMDDDVVV